MGSIAANQTDVIIVGSGPAGLMAAIWLASQGVSISIVETHQSRPPRGRADGFEPRTLEILDSFGLLEPWYRNANRTVELCVWASSHQTPPKKIMRQYNSSEGSSRFYECTTDQAVLERALEDHLFRNYGVQVEYGVECLELQRVETKANPQGSRVTLVSRQRGNVSRRDASYVIGADGGSSWTRKQVGIEMSGSSTSEHFCRMTGVPSANERGEGHTWGVLDIFPLTNFPDIRSRNIFHKEDVGTLMLIPRENGMIRLYIQLDEATASQLVDNDPRSILAIAQQIMDPYYLDFKICHWSSRYNIQQRLASQYTAWDQSVFLVGDAAHTHSPKAGMGLNISMQDSYNLGWKLAAVIRGEASPDLLSSYEEERRPVAEYLVDFDRQFYKLFDQPLSTMSVEEYNNQLVQALAKEHSGLSGISVCYPTHDRHPQSKSDFNSLAPGLCVGRRFPSGTIVNQADGRALDAHQLLRSNGKWRMLVFPGDLRNETALSRYRDLGKELESECDEVSRRCEVVTVHSCPRHEIDLLDLPDAFHPWDDTFGWDYFKVFADDTTPHDGSAGHVYESLEISPEGCVVLLRPDQHICLITAVAGAAKAVDASLSAWYSSESCSKAKLDS